MSLAVVCWRSLRTGATGRGEPVEEHIAKAWVDDLNVAHPEIAHWVEPAPPTPAVTLVDGKVTIEGAS